MEIIDSLRRYDIGNYAIFDLVLAFGGMYLLAPFLSKGFRRFGLIIPVRNWIFLTLPISIMAHLAVGRITSMTRDFVDPDGYYLLKLTILVLFILGARGIKKA